MSRIIIFVLLIAALPLSRASAGFDSTEVFQSILGVYELSNDCEQDTILGVRTIESPFYPKYIYWGNDQVCSTIPDSLKVDSTEFILPDWHKLRTSTAFINFNSDSLMDMVLYTWGKVQLDSTTYKDTSKIVVIFGQPGLDTIPQIIIDSIGTLQFHPFVAMELLVDKDFKNCQYSNLSKQLSWEMYLTDVSLSEPPELPMEVDTKPQTDIKLYPNPAVYYLNIEFSKIPIGRYHILVFNSHGQKVKEELLEINSSNFIKQLDFSQLVTGAYYLRIYNDNNTFGPFPIIIVH
ncbi:MAG: T9SS type A sorting domain-containing protein [Cyclobacteriaceae bacterium]